ncbi:hypothetical protein [Rhodococcus marinonascens]|uniref:hypothetical protein n=1 Tax=Rhodococcus marinonascens TaxID=38311 RepID=UPI000932ED73|nr:hypothetical protein [Rhodococcus marinonascens]
MTGIEGTPPTDSVNRQGLWRFWFAFPDHSEELFSPFLHPLSWPASQARAVCHEPGTTHRAPNPKCLCGFAVVPSLDDFLFLIGAQTALHNIRAATDFRFPQRPVIVSGRVDVRGAVLSVPGPLQRDVLGVDELRVEEVKLRELFVPTTHYGDSKWAFITSDDRVPALQADRMLRNLAIRLRDHYGVPVHLGLPRITEE